MIFGMIGFLLACVGAIFFVADMTDNTHDYSMIWCSSIIIAGILSQFDPTGFWTWWHILENLNWAG
jgi:hypothetical protein